MELSPIEKVKSALRRLNLSESEQVVYLTLLRDGQASARTLAARTGINRSSVYDQLNNLQTRGLVNELDVENVAQFAAADLKHLGALLDDQIDRLEQSRDFVTDALPELRQTLATVDPKVRFFTGEDGLSQLMKDIMWHSHLTVSVLWTSAFTEAFPDTFLAWWNTRRTTRQLTLRTLVANSHSLPDSLSLCRGDQVRYLPRNCPVAMSYLIYDQKVAFISSAAEAYGFIVESNEFATMQQMHFQALWRTAK